MNVIFINTLIKIKSFSFNFELVEQYINSKNNIKKIVNDNPNENTPNIKPNPNEKINSNSVLVSIIYF